MAVAGTINKTWDGGHRTCVTLIKSFLLWIPRFLPLSNEGIGLATEWQMCGRCPLTLSSLPVSGIGAQSMHPTSLSGENASGAGLLQQPVPTQAQVVSTAHMLLKFCEPYHMWISSKFCAWMGIIHCFGQQQHWNIIHLTIANGN